MLPTTCQLVERHSLSDCNLVSPALTLPSGLLLETTCARPVRIAGCVLTRAPRRSLASWRTHQLCRQRPPPASPLRSTPCASAPPPGSALPPQSMARRLVGRSVCLSSRREAHGPPPPFSRPSRAFRGRLSCSDRRVWHSSQRTCPIGRLYGLNGSVHDNQLVGLIAAPGCCLTNVEE